MLMYVKGSEKCKRNKKITYYESKSSQITFNCNSITPKIITFHVFWGF